MKRKVIFFISVFTLLFFVSCGSTPEEETNQPTAPVENVLSPDEESQLLDEINAARQSAIDVGAETYEPDRLKALDGSFEVLKENKERLALEGGKLRDDYKKLDADVRTKVIEKLTADINAARKEAVKAGAEEVLADSLAKFDELFAKMQNDEQKLMADGKTLANNYSALAVKAKKIVVANSITSIVAAQAAAIEAGAKEFFPEELSALDKAFESIKADEQKLLSEKDSLIEKYNSLTDKSKTARETSDKQKCESLEASIDTARNSAIAAGAKELLPEKLSELDAAFETLKKDNKKMLLEGEELLSKYKLLEEQSKIAMSEKQALETLLSSIEAARTKAVTAGADVYAPAKLKELDVRFETLKSDNKKLQTDGKGLKKDYDDLTAYVNELKQKEAALIEKLKAARDKALEAGAETIAPDDVQKLDNYVETRKEDKELFIAEVNGLITKYENLTDFVNDIKAEEKLSAEIEVSRQEAIAVGAEKIKPDELKEIDDYLVNLKPKKLEKLDDYTAELKQNYDRFLSEGESVSNRYKQLAIEVNNIKSAEDLSSRIDEARAKAIEAGAEEITPKELKEIDDYTADLKTDQERFLLEGKEVPGIYDLLASIASDIKTLSSEIDKARTGAVKAGAEEITPKELKEVDDYTAELRPDQKRFLSEGKEVPGIYNLLTSIVNDINELSNKIDRARAGAVKAGAEKVKPEGLKKLDDYTAELKQDYDRFLSEGKDIPGSYDALTATVNDINSAAKALSAKIDKARANAVKAGAEKLKPEELKKLDDYTAELKQDYDRFLSEGKDIPGSYDSLTATVNDINSAAKALSAKIDKARANAVKAGAKERKPEELKKLDDYTAELKQDYNRFLSEGKDIPGSYDALTAAVNDIKAAEALSAKIDKARERAVEAGAEELKPENLKKVDDYVAELKLDQNKLLSEGEEIIALYDSLVSVSYDIREQKLAAKIDEARERAIEAGVMDVNPKELKDLDNYVANLKHNQNKFLSEGDDILGRYDSLVSASYDVREKKLISEIESARDRAVKAGAEELKPEDLKKVDDYLAELKLDQQQLLAEGKDVVTLYDSLVSVSYEIREKQLAAEIDEARARAVAAGAEDVKPEDLKKADDYLASVRKNQQQFLSEGKKIVNLYDSLVTQVYDTREKAITAEIDEARNRAVAAGAEELTPEDLKRVDDYVAELKLDQQQLLAEGSDIVSLYDSLASMSYDIKEENITAKIDEARNKAIESGVGKVTPENLKKLDDYVEELKLNQQQFLADGEKIPEYYNSLIDLMNEILAEEKLIAVIKLARSKSIEAGAETVTPVELKKLDGYVEILKTNKDGWKADSFKIPGYYDSLTRFVNSIKAVEYISGKINDARANAVVAGADEDATKELKSIDNYYESIKDDKKALIANGHRVANAYKSLIPYMSAVETKEMVDYGGLASYAPDCYNNASDKLNSVAAGYNNVGEVEGTIIQNAMDAKKDFFSIIADNYDHVAKTERSLAFAEKKNADLVRAAVTQKERYERAVENFNTGDYLYSMDKPDDAIEYYKEAKEEFAALHSDVSEEMLAALAALESAKKNVEESSLYAAEADQMAPIVGELEGIEDEDAVLLEADDYGDPEDAEIDLAESVTVNKEQKADKSEYDNVDLTPEEAYVEVIVEDTTEEDIVLENGRVSLLLEEVNAGAELSKALAASPETLITEDIYKVKTDKGWEGSVFTELAPRDYVTGAEIKTVPVTVLETESV